MCLRSYPGRNSGSSLPFDGALPIPGHTGAFLFNKAARSVCRGYAPMGNETYKGYAMGPGDCATGDLLTPDRYAASGTVTRDQKFVEASGVLGLFDTEEVALGADMSWARAWVDSHG